MADDLLIDEFHSTLFAPADLRKSEYGVIYRTLKKHGFILRLGRAIRNVVRRYPSLRKVRLRITR